MLDLFIKAKCVGTKNFELLFVKDLSSSLSVWQWLIKRPQAFHSVFSNIKGR